MPTAPIYGHFESADNFDPERPIERVESLDDMLEFCFGRLGAPVINIEVTERQAIERIFEATRWFTENHIDGYEEIWKKVTFTEEDELDQSISLSPDVVAVLQVYDPTKESGGGSSEQFERLNFLIANSDVVDFGYGSQQPKREFAHYEITQQYIRMLQQYFKPYYHHEFNRAVGKLRVQGYNIKKGNWVMIRCLKAVDPRSSALFDDPWLKDYCVALIKLQWGNNLRKTRGVRLVGGVEIDGQDILQEARDEIGELKDRFVEEYTAPTGIFWG